VVIVEGSLALEWLDTQLLFYFLLGIFCTITVYIRSGVGMVGVGEIAVPLSCWLDILP
jgi:hypothetical protein